MEQTKATFTYARSGCGAETGGFWHSRSITAGMFTHMRSGRGRICHFLRTKMVWSVRFRSRRGKLGVGPICCGADFAPAPPPLRDHVCVNTCDDLSWSQFCTRLRPLLLRACVNIPLNQINVKDSSQTQSCLIRWLSIIKLYCKQHGNEMERQRADCDLNSQKIIGSSPYSENYREFFVHILGEIITGPHCILLCISVFELFVEL